MKNVKNPKEFFKKNLSFIMEKKKFLYPILGEALFFSSKCKDMFCYPQTENLPLLCITSYVQISFRLS